MTRSCCPTCRVRFSRATAASTRSCPFCAGPIHLLPVDAVLGLKLVAIEPLLDDEPSLAQAVALALPIDHARPRPRA
jgi:hypothetical protein